MPTALFTWELVADCSVAQYYLKNQPHYITDYQVIYIKAISASHKKAYKAILNYNSVKLFLTSVMLLFYSVQARQCLCSTVSGSISKGVSFTLPIACKLLVCIHACSQDLHVPFSQLCFGNV